MLLRLRRELPRLREPARDEIQALLAPPGPGAACSSASKSQANTHTTTHFHITYDDVAAGLGVAAYAASPERSWHAQVAAFGWAAPPVLGANPALGVAFVPRGCRVVADEAGATLTNPYSPGDRASIRTW